MSDSASRSAAASDVSGSSRLPSTIEKSHLADSGSDSFTSSDRELSAGGGGHSGKSPQSQPVHHTSAPLQDHLVHATADLASLAENDDRSRHGVSAARGRVCAAFGRTRVATKSINFCVNKA